MNRALLKLTMQGERKNRWTTAVRSVIMQSLAFAGLVTLAATFAHAGTGKGDEIMVRTFVPPIDASAPRETETVTFALG